MPPFLTIALTTLPALLFAAGMLHLLPRLGPPGKAITAWLAHAPGLDLIITYFTAAPMILGLIAGVQLHPGSPWLGALLGFVAAVCAQAATIILWTICHELANRKHLKEPRIVHVLNRAVGPFNNHAALWWSALAVPVFWLIRVAEYIVYPPLTWLIKLPKYNDAEWVNVSRHKFDGLVGHDLIWCLYCDWMTGLWSLGSEMLRNIESFWCPIRFHSTNKCENCKHDFPDVEDRWAPANSGMAEVVRRLEAHYPGPEGENSWWGHPTRLSVSAPKKDKPTDE